MILVLLLTLLLFNLLATSLCKERQRLVAILGSVYLIFTVFDLIYLINTAVYPFHPSDATNYYINTINSSSLLNLLENDSSNMFYYVITWINVQIYSSPILVSLFAKLSNLLMIFISYLLLTRSFTRISKYDYFLLCNPYLLLVILRNTRDVYIILFVTLALLSLGIIKSNQKVNKGIKIINLFLLAFTRLIMFIPIGGVMILVIRNRYLKLISFTSIGCLVIVFFNEIYERILNQVYSVMSVMEFDVGFNYEELLGLKGTTALSVLLPKLFLAVVSFFTTPHPIVLLDKWIANMGDAGYYGIYTGVDNVLIILGAFLNYLVLLPILISLPFKTRYVNFKLFVFSIIYALIYIVAYLGITDIRNRHLFYYFMLMSVILGCPKKFKVPKWAFGASGCLFIGYLIINYF